MNSPISIIPLTCEILEPLSLNPHKPHRHDHEELWIITHGSPSHAVDFMAEKLQSPVVVYIAQGKVHSFIPDTETQGWLIRYKTDFVPQSRFNFYSAFADKVYYQLSEDYCSTTLHSLCTIMLKESAELIPDYTVMQHLLSAVLAKLETDSKRDYLDNKASGTPRLITFNNFLRILDNNFRRAEGVEFYAEKLNMTARNLNLITRSVFGKSATEIIETRKLREARRLLLTTEKSVSEIGFELGYNEKSYFSRVFRKKTGATPTAFRTQALDLIS
ncbi:MAG: helix-turn-helix domain-containing protein [Lentimicrobiaceae bacterium]|nr:helix-turn-helix domain-containing protein [Lentimicrobiaceae bacterium]HPG32506.1 AraC family transcriptional regulator [Lentimicrobium sp.]